MIEERILRMLIKNLLKEENTRLRSTKGYNAAHPVVSRKPFMKNLGKSEYDEEQTKKKIKGKKEVEVSKAFDKDTLEQYEAILEGLLNAKNLY